MNPTSQRIWEVVRRSMLLILWAVIGLNFVVFVLSFFTFFTGTRGRPGIESRLGHISIGLSGWGTVVAWLSASTIFILCALFFLAFRAETHRANRVTVYLCVAWIAAYAVYLNRWVRTESGPGILFLYVMLQVVLGLVLLPWFWIVRARNFDRGRGDLRQKLLWFGAACFTLAFLAFGFEFFGALFFYTPRLIGRLSFLLACFGLGLALVGKGKGRNITAIACCELAAWWGLGMLPLR